MDHRSEKRKGYFWYFVVATVVHAGRVATEREMKQKFVVVKKFAKVYHSVPKSVSRFLVALRRLASVLMKPVPAVGSKPPCSSMLTRAVE